MSLSDLTRDAVLKAVQEFDALGREAALRRYSFGRARDYFLVYDGRRYDSKAVAGVAHKFAVPSAGALRAADFSGGEAAVVRVLERLGFTVEGPRQSSVFPSRARSRDVRLIRGREDENRERRCAKEPRNLFQPLPSAGEGRKAPGPLQRVSARLLRPDHR